MTRKITLHRRNKNNGGGRGGTLLEVLISLVILCLIVSGVLDGMRHVRSAKDYATLSEWASQQIAHWKQGRYRHESWAMGDSGTMDAGNSLIYWQLEPLTPLSGENMTFTSDSTPKVKRPDEHWRQCTISTAPWGMSDTDSNVGSGSDDNAVWTFVVRLQPDRPPTSNGSDSQSTQDGSDGDQ